MGIRASFNIISINDFNNLITDKATEYKNETNSYFIDKSWYELDELFSKYGSPLSFAISGDCLSPMNPVSFGEFQKGESDYFFGLMSPKLVKEIASALKQFELTGIDYLDKDLSILIQAYNDASKSNNALSIIIV